jgi:hypothetical protein
LLRTVEWAVKEMRRAASAAVSRRSDGSGGNVGEPPLHAIESLEGALLVLGLIRKMHGETWAVSESEELPFDVQWLFNAVCGATKEIQRLKARARTARCVPACSAFAHCVPVGSATANSFPYQLWMSFVFSPDLSARCPLIHAADLVPDT